jgi:uracil-DNA glycosylase
MITHVPADFPNPRGRKVIAFIGEAPGDDETNPPRGRPRPLIGPSGRVYDAMLRTSGIVRAHHFTGNVFDEKLPNNDVANWCAPTDEFRAWKDGDPTLAPIGRLGYLRPEHQWHLARLRSELEEVKPDIIVPMGGTALWAFTGIDEIGQMRGNTMVADRILPGVKLLPTYHPALVIKQWKWYVVGVGDFMKAAREAEFPEVRHRARRLHLEPTIDDLWAYKRDVLDKAPYHSADIETGWGQITCVGIGPGPEEALCCPFVDLRNPTKSYWGSTDEELEAWRWVRENLESPIPLIGQNFTYDAYWLLPKSLAFMAARYENTGPWKTWRRVGKGGTEKRDD